MEFGRHIGKGIWGFADKSLTAIYGLGFVFLVIRVLPEIEYGSFVLVQAIFTILVAIGTSFALQPLIKYAAESDDYGGILTVCALYFCGFLTATIILLMVVRLPLSQVLDPSHAGKISALILYIPPLLIGSAARLFLIALLQTRYRVQQIFWIDSVYFIGSLVLFSIARQVGRFSTAEDLMVISVATQVLSSLLAVIVAWNHIRFERRVSRSEFQRVWDFGKYSSLSSISFSIYSQLDIFIISSLGGLVQVAVYSAAKIFTRVFDVYTQVVQLFLIPASSRYHKEGNTGAIRIITEKSIWFSTLGLLPVCALFFFGAGFLVDFFYQGRYAAAVIPLRIFSILAILIPWYAVLPSILIGLGKVKEGLLISWVFIVASIVLYYALIPPYGAAGAALANVITILCVSVSMAVITNRIIPLNVRAMVLRTHDIVQFGKTSLEKMRLHK